MSLPRFAIARPIATVMVTLSLCLLGLFALFKLPVDLMPNAGAPSLTVFIGIRGGLPPEDIEDLVTKIVEEAVATTQHLRSVMSVSRKDRAVSTLIFEPGTDASFAALEVQERLAKIKNKLPKDIEKPIVARYSENDYPVLILSMTSDKKSPEQLRELVDNQLKPRLTRVTGIANVEVGGGRERKILIELDQNRLEAYNLNIREITGKIGANNLNLLTGKTEDERNARQFRVMGIYNTIDDIKKLNIAVTKEGSRINLEDVATVRDFYMDEQSRARLNGKPTVSVYVQKEGDTNTIRVAKKARDVVEAFKATLPPDVDLATISDQSVFIQSAIDNVVNNLTYGAILTYLVILFFLKDWRHTTVIFVSVPITILITFGLMMLMKVNLNVMTLSAIALGIGMVVDNATVVLENVLHAKRHALREEAGAVDGESAPEGKGVLWAFSSACAFTFGLAVWQVFQGGLDVAGLGICLVFVFLVTDMLLVVLRSATPVWAVQATIQGTEELWTPLLGSTITVVVVFLPIVFINKQVQILYAGLAITITFSMVTSLFIALTVVPLLASRLPLPKDSRLIPPAVGAWAAYGWYSVPWPGFLLRRFPALFVYGGEAPGGPPTEGEGKPEAPPGRLRRFFRRMGPAAALAGAVWRDLRARPRAVFVRASAWALRRQAVLILCLTIATAATLFVYVRLLPKDFMGSGEQNEFVIFVELPAGAKMDISDQVVAEVEKVLQETPEIAKVVKTAAARVEGWSSKVYVTLASRAERTRGVADIISELRPKVSDIGSQYDAFIYFSEPEASKEFLIDVFGHDYDKLRDLASAIAQKLGEVKGLTDVKLRYKPGRPEVQIVVDKDKAAVFGFSVKDIAETIHNQVRGMRATYFYTENQQVESVIRLEEKYRKTLEDVHTLTIPSPEGNMVPIEQVANFGFSLTPSEIWRRDKQRMIQVSANREHLPLSEAAEKAREALKTLDVPENYYWQVGGDYVDMVQNEKEFRFAFFIMAGLVFIVLASLFESTFQAGLIMATIPMALIGSIPLLYLTKTPATMGVYIGMIMLGGIVVSAAIILVEKINAGRAEGRSLERSVLEAALLRLSPILNTSLTTIVDLVPMVTSKSESAQLWSPLALTVIGGVTVATFLTLFIVPGLFYHVERWRARAVEKLGLAG